MTGKYVFCLSNFFSPAEKIYYTLFLFYVVLFWLFIWQANQSFFYERVAGQSCFVASLFVLSAVNIFIKLSTVNKKIFWTQE